MNRTELIEAIANKSGLTKKDSEKTLSAFMDTVKETLAAGDKIALTGFMSFETVDVSERNARNPKTGEIVISPAHKKVRTKIGATLKSAVNA